MSARVVVVTGAGGQVGRESAAALARLGWEVRALDREALDIVDEAAVGRAVAGASFMVNAAAYTAVDLAETERERAFSVNAAAVGALARACRAADAALLHFSTDYVFDGSGERPWREDDPVRPLTCYGMSKAEGERSLRTVLSRHLILRTSWVFAAHGKNFVRTMLRLLEGETALRVVDDQVGGPTSAADIADAAATMIDAASRPGFSAWGTYHFAGAPDASWCEVAEFVRASLVELDRGSRSRPPVRAISSADYPAAASRPLNSRLDCSRIRAVFGVDRPDWRIAARSVVADLARAGGRP